MRFKSRGLRGCWWFGLEPVISSLHCISARFVAAKPLGLATRSALSCVPRRAARSPSPLVSAFACSNAASRRSIPCRDSSFELRRFRTRALATRTERTCLCQRARTARNGPNEFFKPSFPPHPLAPKSGPHDPRAAPTTHDCIITRRVSGQVQVGPTRHGLRGCATIVSCSKQLRYNTATSVASNSEGVATRTRARSSDRHAR
jgi:hypothetical protein